MGNYDFIIDNIRFSYSSANSYNGCKHGFYLTYIESKDRIDNAFANYGTLVHETIEKYFKGEIESWDMAEYYKSNYDKMIKVPFPPYPAGLADGYYKNGLEFFENFSFDKSPYDVVSIEEKISSSYNGVNIIVKPDLILREKESGEYILYDYKTAKIKKTKADKAKQIQEYMNQFQLYSYILWTEKNIEIKKIKIWFIRDNKEHVEDVNPLKVQDTLDWFENTIQGIKTEDKWEPNLDKSNEYFCQQLCSVRKSCKYQIEREQQYKNVLQLSSP